MFLTKENDSTLVPAFRLLNKFQKSIIQARYLSIPAESHQIIYEIYEWQFIKLEQQQSNLNLF